MTTLTPRDLDVAGLATRCYVAGDPDADPVLLVHDGGCGADALLAWAAVAEALAADHHVLAPDLLGFGGSAKVHDFDSSPYAPRIAQLRGLLAQLGVGAVHAVGNSFGGSLLLRAATGAAGGLPLRSVVSVAGTGGPWRTPVGLSATADYRATEADARRVSDLVVGGERAGAEHVAHRLRNSLVPGHWESLQAWGLRNPALPPPTPPDDGYPATLAGVDVPILLVEGSRDVMVEPGWSQRVVDAAPNVRRQVVDSGHSPNIDEPERVVKILREFLDSLS